MKPKRYILAAAAMASMAATAHAQDFQGDLKKFCVSTEQQHCFIKAGNDLCRSPGRGCHPAMDHLPAKIISKSGSTYKVQTEEGVSFVRGSAFLITPGD
ncbi:hypothetical protein LOK46_10550 [Methylobacterium sp. NMS14P]|uniref:hypothetical protein n=1 Tax=Methylobacterium sp. NMS14P TaxID=2894310 RepID=UPI0023586E69|nr:hypothetical protein [Methylobacterium sp. NMS14P]WCS27229.1 hypothetical protein LOK46_10550 [Methylobacterium sp. NMS14P]